MDPVSSNVTGEKSIPVKITVIRGNNLRGNKPDSLQNFVRVEFNGAVLGDSPKEKSVSVEQSAVDYNFTCSFQCSSTAQTLDDVAHKPVILTVVEILPKEKKQKEEKTAALGQATLDLLPLLHGQVSYSTTVLLHPTPGSPGEAASQEGSNKLPCLDVSVSVPEPLLSEAQRLSSNLLKVTVETAYSVPEEWNLASGSGGSGPLPSTYVAALQVPLTANKEQVLLFSNGLLKAGSDRENLSRPRKWPVAPLLAAGAQVLPGGSIEAEPIEQEDGELTSIEDREFRNKAESTGKRVNWDTERRCYVDAGGVASLSRGIGENRLWPVEIMRSLAQGAKGGKAGKPLAEDDILVSFHGVAYVDMGPLLYPGVTRIRGAYRVHPFSEAELLAKTKRTVSVLKEQARAHGCQGRAGQTGSAMALKAAPGRVLDGSQKGGKDIKEMARKPAAQGKPPGADSVTEVETQVDPEGQMYADAKTYIIIEVALEKPLVPKRPAEELAKRVMELIPPRPPLPSRPAGAERAVQEFQNQVASVVGQLLEQYQELFGPAFLPGAKPLDPSTQEQRKTQLLGELNYSGKYLAFKEQLKYCVVRMVREKMLRTEAFSDPEQLRAFLSQLYVFLVDHMHLALNKTLSVETSEAPERPLLDCSQLRHFAREAELTGDYQLAAHYHQERVSRDPTEPSHWFDYGSFYMLTGEHLKAEECYHHAVSIQQSHHPSLMMSGILAEMAGRYEEAQTYLERATSIDPTSVVAWTLFGLFLESQNNSIQAEMAFLEAARQRRATLGISPPCLGTEDMAGGPQLEEEEQEGEKHEEEEAKAACQSPSVRPESSEEERDEEREPDGESVVRGSQRSQRRRHREDYKAEPGSDPARPSSTIYMETVQFLLHNNALQMAQRALSQELLVPEGGLTSCYHVALARLHLVRADYCSAAASLKEALTESFQDPDVWALYGHYHYLTGEHRRAQECYERSLDFVKDASDTHTIYLRLGSTYLQEGKFESAKTIYLRACKSSPSCLTWLGLGIACYRLGELTEAEDALSEANSLNNMNPEVWGYLALVCLKSGRRLEAEQSYKYVIKLNLQKESILREIRELQDQFGFGNPCF